MHWRQHYDRLEPVDAPRLEPLREKIEQLDRWEVEGGQMADSVWLKPLAVDELAEAEALWSFLNEDQRPPQTENTMDYNQDFDMKVAKWIHEARQHTLGLCRRQHINADRVERVGLFVTSLRSIMEGYGGRSLPPLNDKALWNDIGVPASGIEYSSIARTYDKDRVLKWIRLSHSFPNTTASMAQTFDAEMKELEVNIASCGVSVQQAEKINDDAAKVSDKMAELLGDD